MKKRYSRDWTLFYGGPMRFLFLILGVALLGCGEPKFIDKSKRQKEPETMSGADAKPAQDREMSGNLDDDQQAAPNSPSEEQITALARGYQFLKPAIDNECSGCHSDSGIIDLTSFPFKFKGSYTEELVNEKLSNYPKTYQYKDYIASRVILDELIDAIDTGYMPLSGGLKSYPKMLESLKIWKDSIK
jgi:hypothetical protein